VIAPNGSPKTIFSDVKMLKKFEDITPAKQFSTVTAILAFGRKTRKTALRSLLLAEAIIRMTSSAVC